MQVLLKVLGILLLLSFASSALRGSSDGYDKLKDISLWNKYVYWILCKEYDSVNLITQCRVFRELSGKNDRKICNVELKGSKIEDLTALSKDLVSLSWYAHVKNDTQLTISTLNFNTCKGAEARINVPLGSLKEASEFMSTTFLGDAGKIHTVVDIPKACNATLCKLTFDAEGKNAEISDFFKNELKEAGFIVHLDKLDFEKETYLLKQPYQWSWQYALLSPEGLRIIEEYPLLENVAKSTTHGKLRFCRKGWGYDSTILCDTHDARSDVPSETNVFIDVGEDIHPLRYELENLPGGEFLVFANSRDLQKSYVIKIAANGKRVGSLELTGVPKCKTFFCTSIGMLKIVNNKYCRSFLRATSKEFDYGRKCFKDDDFE